MESDQAVDGQQPNRYGTRAPADNNVQDVLSAIDSYTCGPIRALAQDPPQNSADARASGSATVRVVYQVFARNLEDGQPMKLLTITDSGTTGLDGPMLNEDQLNERQRKQGQLVINQGENWAAWEAMRYTKSGQDSLGSRGQGKYAYLWHSANPVPGAPPDSPKHAWRMIILYDTLLPSGEYRLGVRFHNPGTRLLDSPFLGEAAFDVLRNGYRDEQWYVPLGLDPLTEPGTRVIIPFLSNEAQEAIRSGELVHWLTAEWWQQIRKKDLAIAVIDEEGGASQIGVPPFWDLKKWSDGDERYFVRENLNLPSDSPGRRRRVKRVVFFQDDDLPNDDVEGPPQFNGVQILRGGQWITTMEMRQSFGDLIPQAHRAGFRGFVELEQALEREFREIELPAHDGFNRRSAITRELEKLVEDLVREFAASRGWVEKRSEDQTAGFEDLVQELADLFVSPGSDGGNPGGPTWSCGVELIFPGTPGRADWGDRIHVYAHCNRIPAGARDDVAFRVALIRPDGIRVGVLGERNQRLSATAGGESSSATANFGNLAVERGWRPEDPFKEPGRYSVEVTCSTGGEKVASGRASFYLASIPDPPPIRPVTLQLEAFNADDGGRSIEYGEQLAVIAAVRNYTDSPIKAYFAIAIEDVDCVLESREILLPGIAVGGTVQPFSLNPAPRKVEAETAGGEVAENEIRLAPGKHVVVASVEKDGDIVASAAVPFFVGKQDDDDGADIPFEVKEIPSDPTAPRWRLEDPSQASANYILWLSTEDPLYRGVRLVTRVPAGAARLPIEDFVQQAIAEGLVEWAVREYDAKGDEGRLRLVGSGLSRIDSALSERFQTRVERLMGATAENPSLYGETQRELAAIMLEAAQRAR